jgi:hypothetical protein
MRPTDAPGDPAWEPEPLELPVDDDPPRRRIREGADEGEDHSGPPGSYVIVIDLN